MTGSCAGGTRIAGEASNPRGGLGQGRDTGKTTLTPPCPRCDLHALRVEEFAAELEKAITVRHCSYQSTDTAAVGRSLHRRFGIAKHVSEEAGVPMNWDVIYLLVEERKQTADPDSRPAGEWAPKLAGHSRAAAVSPFIRASVPSIDLPYWLLGRPLRMRHHSFLVGKVLNVLAGNRCANETLYVS